MPAEKTVLAVRYGHRVTSYAEMYLNYHLYGEPDADLDIAYYFWIIRDGNRVTLVDTGFAPEVGDRRRREHHTTPVQALTTLGIAPADKPECFAHRLGPGGTRRCNRAIGPLRVQGERYVGRNHVRQVAKNPERE